MKTTLAAIVTLACVSFALAADMTITIPDQDVPRVQEAYGSILGLGRPATPPEVQKAITDWLHQSTLDYERRKNTYTYTPPPMHFPTPAPSPTAGGLAAPNGQRVAEPTATPTPKKKK